MLDIQHTIQVPSRVDLYVHLVPGPLPPGPASDLLRAVGRLIGEALLRRVAPPKPGRFALLVTANGDPGTMQVTAQLPEKTAPDVRTYELTYAIDGGPPQVLSSDGTPITFPAPLGSTVVASFVEIDAAGNRSPSSDPETLVVEDTISPPKPGSFNLAVTADDAAPVPA